MMKKVMLSFALVVLASISPAAFAVCPTPPTGPYSGGGLGWYEYSADPACVDTFLSVTPVTMCSYYSGWVPGVGTAYRTFQYDFVDITGHDTWSSSIIIDFNDPNNSSSNYVELWARVTHSGVDTWTQLFQWDGTDGDLSCQRRGDFFFSQEGDAISIFILAKRSTSNVTLSVSSPLIFGYNT